MWVLATRNRVANCQRFIDAWRTTQATTPVYVRLDECDPDLDCMKNLPWPSEFEIVIGPRSRIGPSLQEAFHRYPNLPWYGYLADDLIPQTPGWDQKLIAAAAPNRISYANDVWEKEVRVCHPCIGGDLVRAVGFLALPVVQHWGTDSVWERLHHDFRMNGRQQEVIVEHAHFKFDLATVDQTYKDSQNLKRDDKNAFYLWLENDYPELRQRIANEFGWSTCK
jgi:hypothetical protein